jgi:heptaprenyl diphosphate synthase
MPTSNRKLARLALLVSVGLILYIFEAYIPQPLPWVRIGLANMVSLLALVLWGFWEALAVLLMRVLLGSIFTGTILSPVFPFALVGGLASVMTMGVARRFLCPPLSVVGISVLGALAHNVSQLLLAYGLYIRRSELFFLLPPLLLSTLLTGCLIGLIVALVTARGVMESWQT